MFQVKKNKTNPKKHQKKTKQNPHKHTQKNKKATSIYIHIQIIKF